MGNVELEAYGTCIGRMRLHRLPVHCGKLYAWKMIVNSNAYNDMNDNNCIT